MCRMVPRVARNWLFVIVTTPLHHHHHHHHHFFAFLTIQN